MKTESERVKKYIQKKKKEGYVKVQLWIPIELRNEFVGVRDGMVSTWRIVYGRP